MATAVVESGVPSEDRGKETKPRKKANKNPEINMEDKVASYFASMNPMAKRIVIEQMKYKQENRKVWKSLDQSDKDRLIDGLFIIPQLTEAYIANRTDVSESTMAPPPEVFPKLKVVTGQKMVVYSDEGSTNKAKTFKWKDEYSDPFSWETKSQLNLTLPSPEEDIGINLPKTPKPSEQDIQQLRGSSDSIDHSDDQVEQSDEDDQRTETGTVEGASLDKLSFDFDFDKKSSSQHSLQFSLGGDSEYDNVSVHSTSSRLLEERSSPDKLMEEVKEKIRERERSRETMTSTSSSSTMSSTRSDRKDIVKHPDGYTLLEEKPQQVRKTRNKDVMTLDNSEVHANLSAIEDMRDSPKLPDKSATMPPAPSDGGGIEFDFLTNW